MNAAPLTNLPVVLQSSNPPETSRNANFQHKISTFSKRVFAELSVSLVINWGVMMMITVTPLSISALTWIAATALIGVTVRMIFESQFDDNQDDFVALMTPVGEFIGRLSVVNSIGTSTFNIWIHEAGHALAAACCFLKPNIKIQWSPFLHGDTSFSVSNGMTKLGGLLGKHNAIMLFRGAGLICSSVFAMTEIGAAFYFKDSSPQVSLTLTCHAISQIASDVLYGLAALASRGFNVRNDYLALWKIGGIHPAIPMIAMVALPIIEYCALRYFCS